MKKPQRGVWPTAHRQVALEQSLLHNRSQNDLGSNTGFCRGEKTGWTEGGKHYWIDFLVEFSPQVSRWLSPFLFDWWRQSNLSVRFLTSTYLTPFQPWIAVIIDERQRIMIWICQNCSCLKTGQQVAVIKPIEEWLTKKPPKKHTTQHSIITTESRFTTMVMVLVNSVAFVLCTFVFSASGGPQILKVFKSCGFYIWEQGAAFWMNRRFFAEAWTICSILLYNPWREGQSFMM